MRVLLAVFEDLYTFAVGSIFGWQQERQLTLPAVRTLQTVPSFGGVDVLVRPTARPQRNSVVYCATPDAPLRTAPNDGPDTTIATLAYGDMAMVLRLGEEWTYVAAGERQGYVETAALSHKAADVYPSFTVGEPNGPRDLSTVRLRLIIRDEFSGGASDMPLSSHEYVYYKLVRRGTTISWPDIRPRTAGNWMRILLENERVMVEDVPQVGAVMEYREGEDGAGRLAYVEKVFPDGSIQISEADWPDRGIYNERVMVEDEWRALAPVFLVIA